MDTNIIKIIIMVVIGFALYKILRKFGYPEQECYAIPFALIIFPPLVYLGLLAVYVVGRKYVVRPKQ